MRRIQSLARRPHERQKPFRVSASGPLGTVSFSSFVGGLEADLVVDDQQTTLGLEAKVTPRACGKA